MDHTLLVVNRLGNNLNDPTTWGDAYIVDPWCKEGVVFHAKNYNEYKAIIKDFITQQAEYRKSLRIKVAAMPYDVRLVAKWSLCPLMHCYPVYEAVKKLKIIIT